MPASEHIVSLQPDNAKFGRKAGEAGALFNMGTMKDDLEVSIYAHFLNKLQRPNREWLKLDPACSSAGVFDRQQESNFRVFVTARTCTFKKATTLFTGIVLIQLYPQLQFEQKLEKMCDQPIACTHSTDSIMDNDNHHALHMTWIVCDVENSEHWIREHFQTCFYSHNGLQGWPMTSNYWQ